MTAINLQYLSDIFMTAINLMYLSDIFMMTINLLYLSDIFMMAINLLYLSDTLTKACYPPARGLDHRSLALVSCLPQSVSCFLSV